MTKNVGSIDKILRIVTGLTLLGLFFVLDSPYKYLGLVGIVPLATALLNFCPLYTVFGINTCSKNA
ncbi:MAG TPA: DUF2892 domain-containing protein [Oligoflexia bacterium]|nr:DUF2892 domain-containing protein [Oligoflexia bacterium]HMR25066.1 DUF2892 domain-containing protein [Oligoflexia bacterium]